MRAFEIRQSFLDFFSKVNHKIVPSAPVVPLDDPTLLFTNAGMNQFKDVFLGTGNRSYSRAADSQKCIRVSGKHNDLEEVGHDTYHHTFFEMMGNWSFGDYYKEEAILWAWELVTQVWSLEKNRLWATVFTEDDEAEMIWKKVTDIKPLQVLRFGKKENFWEMGETGPCGPCSEIHIDLGEMYCDRKHVSDHVCGVNMGCARFIELWNLVFIQYNRDEVGNFTVLPKKHIDTGLGLERAVAILQGKASNYQTDLFIPIMDKISELTGKTSDEPTLLPSFQVIADHIRTLTFAITDGALPSNEGRGYVLRRLLRRAARYGRNLDIHEPFIYKLVSVVIDIMGKFYQELEERSQHTTLVIKAEEERFNEVLDRGIEIFEEITLKISKKGQSVIPGEEAFKLYDTFGFPLDLTQLMAREKGFDIDIKGFEKKMEAQRERAKQNQKFSLLDHSEWEEISKGPDSEFIGYETTTIQTEIRKIKRDGETIILLLSQTPFYGESGGQVGDKGKLVGEDFCIQIENTKKQGDQILHIGLFSEGSKITNSSVEAIADRDLRLSTARNHTATHLLHKALREVVGDHVSQAGSLVAPNRMRFDFTHFEPMNSEQIDEVEWRVNDHIRRNHTVKKFITSLEKAKRDGATALFGEKYDDQVRVVKIDDYSMELCGGTHLDSTGQIGYFRILSEEGIAAGIRRIEALTGEKADHLIRKEKNLLHHIVNLLQCRTEEVESRINTLLEAKKQMKHHFKETQQTAALSELDLILKNVQRIDDVQVVNALVHINEIDELRHLGDRLREQLKSGIGVLSTEINDKVNFLCVVTDDLIEKRNLNAVDIVREIGKRVQGGGGGKPHMALAGGKDKTKFKQTLKHVPAIIEEFLS